MKKKKLLSLMLVTAFAVTLFAGCGGSSEPTATESAADSSEADTSGEQTATSSGGDKLTMATNATFPPYEYVEGSDYLGIDVEIAGEIASRLGMTLDIQDVEFDSIIAGVQSGKYDIGMAGMTVTEERKQSVNFTDTYATGIQSIIVKEGSSIASVDDLSADTKIGVQQGTTGDIYASDDYGDEAVTRYKTGADAVQALLTDKIDCVIIDNEPAKSFVSANDGLMILDTSYAEEDYAICVSKDNEELLSSINEALKELKEDGTIDQIVSMYIPAE